MVLPVVSLILSGILSVFLPVPRQPSRFKPVRLRAIYRATLHLQAIPGSHLPRLLMLRPAPGWVVGLADVLGIAGAVLDGVLDSLAVPYLSFRRRLAGTAA